MQSMSAVCNDSGGMSTKRHTFPLPPEIKQKIYELVLQEKYQPAALKAAHEFALCRTTRQIHSECYSAYLQINHFWIRGLQSEYLWFSQHIKSFPDIHQNLRKLTFRLHRPCRLARNGIVAEYKRYKGTKLIMESLAQCNNLDLTILCRFDELQDMYLTDVLSKFCSFSFQPLRLPKDPRYCSVHSVKPLRLPYGPYADAYLETWGRWYDCVRSSLGYSSKTTSREISQSKFTAMVTNERNADCWDCLIELHLKGKVELPVCWPD